MLIIQAARHRAWHECLRWALCWAHPEGCWLQGEVGRSKLSSFVSLEDAKKDFEKKFRDKTKNSWAERDHFVAHPGKYALIEVLREDEAQEAVVKVRWPGKAGGSWAERRDREAQPAGLCQFPAVPPQAPTTPLWPQAGPPLSGAGPCSKGRCPSWLPCLPQVPSSALGGRRPSEDRGSAGAALLPGHSHAEAH